MISHKPKIYRFLITQQYDVLLIDDMSMWITKGELMDVILRSW